MQSKPQSTPTMNSTAANNNRISTVILWIVFVTYLLVLFYLLFLAETMGRGSVGREYHYNLVPFQEIRRYWNILGKYEIGCTIWKISVMNLFGNILAFMPLGYFLPKLISKCKNGFLTVLVCMEVSLCVELLQLALKLGCCDIDDLLLNTFGGLLGYLVYLLIHAISIKSAKK